MITKLSLFFKSLPASVLLILSIGVQLLVLMIFTLPVFNHL